MRTIRRMGKPGHHGADDLLIARVRGIVARRAERPPVDLAAAVAEIHAVTTDPHLLGHAWQWPARYAVFADEWADAKNAILGAAGADPQRPDDRSLC